MKEYLVKFYDFFVVAFYVLGVIGGAGNLFDFHQPLFGVTTILLGAMAFPYAWGRLKDLLA